MFLIPGRAPHRVPFDEPVPLDLPEPYGVLPFDRVGDAGEWVALMADGQPELAENV